VASRRLTAFVSSPLGLETLFYGQPCFAVRFEEHKDDWPVNLRQALENAIAPSVKLWNDTVSENPESPDSVVEWALANGRCWIALDGLDQVDDHDRLKNIREFLRHEGANSRVLLTGRPYVVSGNETPQQYSLLNACTWRFATIIPFGLRDQYAYLEQVLPVEHRGIELRESAAEVLSVRQSDRLTAALSSRLPAYELVADLMSVPIVLRIIRDLLQVRPDVKFHSRGELYAEASRMTLRMTGRKTSTEPEWRNDVDVELLEQISAAVAIQMAIDHTWSCTGVARLISMIATGSCFFPSPHVRIEQ
jgi:hypothetical protein